MYNRRLLEEVINNSGCRKNFISKKSGICYPTFIKKVRGDVVWKLDDIEAIQSVLGFDADTRNSIFFGDGVNKTVTDNNGCR